MSIRDDSRKHYINRSIKQFWIHSKKAFLPLTKVTTDDVANQLKIMEVIFNSLLAFIALAGFGVLDLQFSEAGDFMQEVCLQPMDEGRECEEAKPHIQYYFSSELEKCAPFQYKGCGGNNNRFMLQDDCTDACQVEYYKRKNKKAGVLQSNEETDKSTVTKEDCKLPMEKGPCRAMITQWYFDTESKTCKTFSYGGCSGNKNRFNTEEVCQYVCMDKKD